VNDLVETQIDWSNNLFSPTSENKMNRNYFERTNKNIKSNPDKELHSKIGN